MITKDTVQRFRITNNADQYIDVEVPATGDNCRLNLSANIDGYVVLLVEDVVKLGELLSGKRKK